jgi:hypothetical protein
MKMNKPGIGQKYKLRDSGETVLITILAKPKRNEISYLVRRNEELHCYKTRDFSLSLSGEILNVRNLVRVLFDEEQQDIASKTLERAGL